MKFQPDDIEKSLFILSNMSFSCGSYFHQVSIKQLNIVVMKATLSKIPKMH